MPTCLSSELILPLVSSASRVLNMKIHSLRVLKLLFALSFLGSVPCVFAASFDCGKAARPTEKLICSDAETSTLDGKLQQTYKTALAATDAPGKKALAKEQRNWIKYTRGICQDTICLHQTYIDRIALLARNQKNIENDESYCARPGGYKGGVDDCVLSVQAYRDPNDHIDSFNQSLAEQKQSGRILGCRRLIDLWSGTHIGPGRGEQSFGGYCVLQTGVQRRNVAICNDDMVGDFQVQPVIPQNMSDPHLIDFIYHCSGS